MKRLVIFCDGTWNQLSKLPTNVVLGAQMVLPASDDGIDQIVYYKQGVGTTHLINQRIEAWLAGAFGFGLFDNIADAYRFLVFNYQAGDEIYIFGFSRGAFTARSLAGLIRKCGIVIRDRLDKVEEAFEVYRVRGEKGKPDNDLAQRFRAENSPETIMKDLDRKWRREHGYEVTYDDEPLFRIKYLGVWDTVGALGIPKYLIFEQLFGTAKKYQFHDMHLSSIIEWGRHALALDETRLAFAQTVWGNLHILNEMSPGHHEEKWFPGDHGSVGGGGDITGLSSAALEWVMEGAQQAGLALNGPAMENVHASIHPDDPLRNMKKKPGLLDKVMRRAPRKGPTTENRLSGSTMKRLNYEAKSGSGWQKYRPASILPLLRKMFPDEKL
jgi:uncharacterized protein (DUF2235 family)